jgi:anion-transporting  ArsA/GET3 family ATPase
MSRALLVTGSGGVGKTTVAGALGVLAADQGISTLVLTVDPARRLAQALGIDEVHMHPHRVADHLDAAMLDPTASWEALIRRHTDEPTADRIVTSRFFRAIADRFPAGQAYAAADDAARFMEAGDHDLVVVDTPPFGGGADFYGAPGEIRELVAGRALRVLTGPPIPGRRALFGVTARPALRLADRVLGGPLLEDLGSFLVDLRSAYDGIRHRARDVEETIESATPIIVTTPDPGPAAEAHTLLERRHGTEAQVVLNRVLPTSWIGHGDDGGDAHDRNLARWASEALRHRWVAETFVRAGATVVPVAWRSEAPTTLAALLEVAVEGDFGELLP